MGQSQIVTIRRFPHDADEQARRDFGRRLLESLDATGIAPGQEFVIGHPEVLDPRASELGPFARRSRASRNASLENYPRAGSQRERVLLAIARAGQRGYTRDELAERLELPDSTVDARVSELKRGGFLRDTDLARATRAGGRAQVLAITRKSEVMLNPEAAALW
jgi:hypothetical protein